MYKYVYLNIYNDEMELSCYNSQLKGAVNFSETTVDNTDY